jgi:hypothetical protein
MARIILVLVFAALLFPTALYPNSLAFADSTTPIVKEPVKSERWDDWACKNLKTDWNYLFHPDRINQYIPPENTIDRDRAGLELVP